MVYRMATVETEKEGREHTPLLFFSRNLPCLQQQLEVEGHAGKLGEALAVRQEAEAVAAQRRALLPAPPSDTSRSLLPPPALLAFAPRFTQSSSLGCSEL